MEEIPHNHMPVIWGNAIYVNKVGELVRLILKLLALKPDQIGYYGD